MITVDGHKKLNDIYVKKRYTDDLVFDAELTEDLIKSMKRGKAACMSRWSYNRTRAALLPKSAHFFG